METDVVIAGGGPTGLMLAHELRLAGIDVVVLDALDGRQDTESRAGGIHARTMEVLDQRGILGPFLAAGRPIRAAHFAGLWLSLDNSPTRYPYLLQLLQRRVEELLEARVAERGVTVRWGSEVTGVRQDVAGVEVTVRGSDEPVRAAYLVGCDGGRSAVRKLAGVGFPGTPASMTALLGDVELGDPPAEPVFQARRETGSYTVLEFEPGWHRVMTDVHGRVADQSTVATLDELRASMISIAGTDFGMRSPRWISRFSDAARQADRYRAGRVFLAGDAAHVHFPAGGQGLNTGVQDAVNLGWKLARVLRGESPDALLDTYHAERHPVAARVLENTRAQSGLGRSDPQTSALREVMAGLIAMPEVNDGLAGMITALDIRYPLGEDHPLIGRRLPDVDLTSDTGGFRAYTLLHAARPVLLDLSGDAPAPPAGIELVRARCAAETWPVPVIGAVPAPAALLIRPDGHIAWVATDPASRHPLPVL